RDVALARDTVGIDEEHVFAGLLAADRRVGNEQRLVDGRARHAHAREHAGREHTVRGGELGAAANGAGRAVDDVVDDIHVAAVLEFALVDELEAHQDVAAAAGHFFAAARQPLVAQIGGLIEGEFEPDRVHRDDGGEQRGAAGTARDQVALADAAV